MSVTITVADIRPPAPGKKQASLIDSTGKRWGISADTQGDYRQFGTYEVKRFKENYFQGKTYYTIESAVPVDAGVAAIHHPVRPPTAPYSAGTDDQRRMDIFVCGAFNNIMANPSARPSEMTSGDFGLIINQLKDAWRRTLGPQAQETLTGGSLDKDMDDSVPF